jgi:hypothetical protein
VSRLKALLALILVFSILSLSLLAEVEAIKIYIGPGEYKQVFYLNVSTLQPASKQGSYTVKNFNNYTIQVSFNATGELAQIIETPKTVILEPNQTENAYFTIRVTEPGTYTGNVNIFYSPYSINATSGEFQPEITVYVNKVQGVFDFLIPTLAIIIAAVVGFVFYKKLTKREKK